MFFRLFFLRFSEKFKFLRNISGWKREPTIKLINLYLPSEIAKMEELDKRNNSARQLIIRVSDQLKAREIKLIELSKQESAAAKARLDEVRKKRRDRHASKKSQYK